MTHIRQKEPIVAIADANEAARIIEARFSQHRQTHAPLEPRGCIAGWDAGRQHLTFRSGTQAPHPLPGQS